MYNNAIVTHVKKEFIAKGKGACGGGANTNKHGLPFEHKTCNELSLINNGYSKHYFANKGKGKYYLSNTFEDKTITFVSQNRFKSYMKMKYNIDLFRQPDEAYIVEHLNGEKSIYILEKKEQHVDGSVETKLWSGPSLKREYEIVFGNHFKVYYGFCVNHYLKLKLTSTHKKYTTLSTILNEHNIHVLFGDDDDYFQMINKWIHNLLPQHSRRECC